jgi:hypothetical protein
MHDLPVRLKRSFEEVCLIYSAFFLVVIVTRYMYEIVLFLLPKYVGLSYRYMYVYESPDY